MQNLIYNIRERPYAKRFWSITNGNRTDLCRHAELRLGKGKAMLAIENELKEIMIRQGSDLAIARFLEELANRPAPVDLHEDEKPIIRAAAFRLSKTKKKLGD